MTSDDGQIFRAARAMDPPMSPSPTMPIFAKTGGWASAARGAWTTGRKSGNLGTPASSRHRLEADAPSDRRGDDAEFRHQPIELRRKHRLRAVAQRVIRVAVHFDNQ